LAKRKPNSKYVDRITEISAKHLQAAVRIIVPTDRDLLDPVTEPLGKCEDLYVEHVPVDTLPPKQVVSDVAPKELEPALCVHNIRQPHHGMHKDPKSSRPNTTIKGLWSLDLRIR
jgi:hypothetical protein